jgi:RimJ/RimL family protein N-acetyltransferase
MIAPLTLQGQHVTLRPLAASDVAALREIAEGPRETFLWANVPKPEGVEAYVSRALATVEKRQALVFAICAGDEVLGCTRLFDLQRWDWPYGNDPRLGQDVLDACESGYTWLAPRAQRSPVNTEAKLLLLRHAFETWKCFRVTIKTDERNSRSRRAIERLGAKPDGILRSVQPAADGKPRNTAYYAVIAQEWPQVQAALSARLART